MPNLKYEHALGLVTRHFQMLELYLSIFAWGLMGKDQRIGQAITAQMSFSKLLVLVSTLLGSKTKNRQIISRFKAIARQAASAEQRRNRIVHSAYLQFSADPAAKLIRYKVTSKLEKGLVIHWEATSFEDVMDVGVEILQAAELLAQLIGQTREKLGIDYTGFEKEADDEDVDIPF